MMALIALITMTSMTAMGYVDGTDYVDGMRWVVMLFLGSKAVDHTNF